MFRGNVRIACLVVGLLVTAGLSYRVLHDEDTLNRERQQAAAASEGAARTAELLLDLSASLHAYVAPGQGLPFWGKRAQDGVESLRQSLMSLDTIVTPMGQSLNDSLDAVDQLAAAERSARTYVSRGDLQLAGDVIFTEIRDLLASATTQVQTIRADLKRGNDQRLASIRLEQIALVGIALAMWIGIAAFLMPTEKQTGVKDPAEWREQLKERLEKPVPTPMTLDALVAPVEPMAPAIPAEPSVTVAMVRQVSEICADLSALADPGALEATLARVSSVLNATGLIVWVASNDGASLSPVACHGFDPKLVARIGRIPRDSANLTAAAFRDNTPKVSAPTASAPGALAAPMCGPTGPAGVLSIELKPGQPVEDSTVALAAIVAAQLATLAMPVPEAAQPEFEEQTRAAL